MTKSSRECYNRPPLGVERQRLDVNQNPSTTHRLAIVGYSLDSISGHFIIQLGQLSHRTPQKRGLQSNWKLHTGPGGDTERGLAVVTPLSFFQLVVVSRDFERKVIGEGGYHYMFGTTCVFMKLMECIWVGEGFNLVSGHGGKKNRGSEEWGGGIQSSEKRMAQRSILEEIIKRRVYLRKEGRQRNAMWRGEEREFSYWSKHSIKSEKQEGRGMEKAFW